MILKNISVVRFFSEKSFGHYVWVGGGFSLANIVLLWVLIDILGMQTILASTLVIVGTFIGRYVVLRLLGVIQEGKQ